MAVVDDKSSSGEEPVHGVGQSRLLVQSPGEIPLVVAPGLVPAPPSLPAVDVPEGAPPACPDAGGSLHHDVPPPQPHVELVVLQPPPPVLVAHAVHLLIAGSGYQQDSSYEGRVVVLGVQLEGGDVVGGGLGELVLDLRVLREQVHVVHCYVVTARVRLSEPHIDQEGSVKPRDSYTDREPQEKERTAHLNLSA